jgi:predicted N-formylglutamate amidohydrolase
MVINLADDMSPTPTQQKDSADFAVFELLAGDVGAPLLFVCEHARSDIPLQFGDLGIAKRDRHSHAVWDPGAEALTRALAEKFNAPAVIGRVSRAVYDLNRPPERADAIPVRSEMIEIPGNRDLGAAERASRAASIHDPFHHMVSSALDTLAPHAALVTVHSFSPTWFGQSRETEIGLLHDNDPSMAEAMRRATEGPLRVELNAPYSAADGVTYTLAKHANPRGIPSVMIEVRNDLLTEDMSVSRVAGQLAAMLDVALAHTAYEA